MSLLDVGFNAGYSDVGFSMQNTRRNAALAKLNFQHSPLARSTGTIIVGCVFKDGVIMACDTRATSGSFIADKNCLKLHRITDSIYACGAGTAADLDKVTHYLHSQLSLHEMNTGRKARAATVTRIAKQHLFQYMGYISVYLLIGGVDFYGSYLASCDAGGSTMTAHYLADGSGCMAALGVLERGFELDLPEEAALKLTLGAVQAGMSVDMACGNGYRYAIIKKTGTTIYDRVVPDFCVPVPRVMQYRMPPQTTKVLKKYARKFDVVLTQKEGEAMETDS